MDEEEPVVVKRRVLCRRCLLRREERRAFQTIFKELAVEDKHAQFVALVVQIGSLRSYYGDGNENVTKQ